MGRPLGAPGEGLGHRTRRRACGGGHLQRAGVDRPGSCHSDERLSWHAFGVWALCRFEARYALNYSALQLNGFLLLLFLLCHWLACGWYLVISIESNAECFPTYNAEVPTEGKTFDPHNWSCCFNWFDCYLFKNAHDGPSIARKCAPVASLSHAAL